MKTRMQQLCLANLLLGISSLASAHGAGDRPGAALYHYMTSPDHLALTGLVAVAAGYFLLRRKRSVPSQRQD